MYIRIYDKIFIEHLYFSSIRELTSIKNLVPGYYNIHYPNNKDSE